MGGYNSGRWGWHSKRYTVEQCYRLDIRHDELQKHLQTKTGNTASLLLIQEYTIQGQPPAITQREFQFTSTGCHFGGLRWWFRCPACTGRCGVLYMPPNSRYFACRKCHHLSYKSAQEAHMWDRGSIGIFAAGFDLRERYNLLTSKLAKHRYGSKAWLRLDAKIEKLMMQIDRGITASLARSAALEAETDAILAKYGG